MKNVELTPGNASQPRKLIVDGEVWEDSSGRRGAHGERMYASFRGASLRRITKLTVRELSAHFENVGIGLPDNDASPYGPWGWEFNWISVGMDRVNDQGYVPWECETYFQFENWSNTYTITDLAQAIQDVLAKHPELPLEYWTRGSVGEGFGVKGSVRLDDTIERVLLLEKDFLELGKLVEAHIERHDRERFEDYIGGALPPHKVSVYFSFPAPVKTACEQYLLYFGQFLSDLGIQVEAELTETAARVLFSVTPNDATQALTQIRDALETYLRLPFLREFSVTASQFHDPAVAQLRANVLHLQSQIVLAKSILQLKDATIQAQDAEIEYLKGIIDLRDYKTRPTQKNEEPDTEPLITGIVSVKKYPLKFLEFDFPAILRKLKRRL